MVGILIGIVIDSVLAISIAICIGIRDCDCDWYYTCDHDYALTGQCISDYDCHCHWYSGLYLLGFGRWKRTMIAISIYI